MAAWGKRVRERLARPTPPAAPGSDGLCVHLRDAPTEVAPLTPAGCGACLEQGTSWPDLRLCLSCGAVGCCDSSPWRHASDHARETGHPVMRSIAPGESWRWCYLDDLLG